MSGFNAPGASAWVCEWDTLGVKTNMLRGVSFLFVVRDYEGGLGQPCTNWARSSVALLMSPWSGENS